MPVKKMYPDRTIENAAREVGAQVICLWQLRGPEHTQIAWIEGLLINGEVVLIQTFAEGGWSAYTALRSNRVDETIADVLARCGISIVVIDTLSRALKENVS